MIYSTDDLERMPRQDLEALAVLLDLPAYFARFTDAQIAIVIRSRIERGDGPLTLEERL